MMAMTYGNVYVASVAIGANDAQTVKAFLEAEAYHGPSLIIAYSHCIAHGYDLAHGPRAAEAGGRLAATGRSTASTRGASPTGESPLAARLGRTRSSTWPSTCDNETRFRMVEQMDPERFTMLLAARRSRKSRARFSVYEQLAKLAFPVPKA